MTPPIANNIHLIDINPLTLTVSWTPSPLNCPATHYIIPLSDDCGLQCPNTSVDTNATCNITSINGHTCSVFIQTVHCGGIIVGNRSEPLEITLKSKSRV